MLYKTALLESISKKMAEVEEACMWRDHARLGPTHTHKEKKKKERKEIKPRLPLIITTQGKQYAHFTAGETKATE